MDRGPRPLAASLDDALAGLAPPRRSKGPEDSAGERGPRRRVSAAALGGVFAGWETIVGPALARHVTPLTLSDGVLSVAVDQPAWATQVRLLGPTILERVAAVTGEAPRRLHVAVRPSQGAP